MISWEAQTEVHVTELPLEGFSASLSKFQTLTYTYSHTITHGSSQLFGA